MLHHFPELERIGCQRTQFAAAIFDFDGTLADSMWVWSDIDRKFCAEYGLAIPDDYADSIAGLGFEGTAQYFIDDLGLQMTLEQCCSEFNRLAFDAYAHEVTLKPGALSYLKLLKSRGVPVAIASSLNIELLEAALRNTGAWELIDQIRLCDDYNTHKLEPKIYCIAAESMGAEIADCVVFEDIVAGIRSAKSVGTFTIALLDEANEAQNTDAVRDLADLALRDFTSLIP